MDNLRGAGFLSSLDIKTAYWQVMLDENSKQYTAFTVPSRGLFQFKRLPFGLHNAPATFQRLVDTILEPELEPYAFVLFDDIIISKDKCHFCLPELKYLSYVVSKKGLHVDPEKVETIINIPKPKNVKEVRRIIGMASWYRKFVPDYSTKIAPLTALLRKNLKFEFNEECDDALAKIKESLISAPVLRCPDFNLPFTVQCDASSYDIAAVLTQKFEDGEHAICYLSRSLTVSERKLTTTERELLAVLWAIEKLRCYLEGSKFYVVTDHYSLKWLANLKNPQGRLGRH